MRKTVSIVTAAIILMAATTAYAERIEFARASESLVEAGSEALEGDNSFEALTLFEQAIVANPKNADAYVGLGQTHVRLGKTKSGLNYFTVALDIEPTHLGALEAEAMTFLSIGEAEDAEDTLVRISRICGERTCAERDNVASAISNFQAQKVADSTE